MDKNIKKEQKYFEIFGDTLNQLSFFKTISLLLVFSNIFLIILIKQNIEKNPIVIRVDNLGNTTAFKNIKNLQNVSKEEISNFTQYFLQYFTSHNFYTYDDDFKKAFNMMTSECQQKMNDYLTTHDTVNSIKNNQLKTKLIITEITTMKDSKEYINIKIKGTREITSYIQPEFFREEIFEIDLSLKKIGRTMDKPWGLLVDSFNESLFKK